MMIPRQHWLLTFAVTMLVTNCADNDSEGTEHDAEADDSDGAYFPPSDDKADSAPAFLRDSGVDGATESRRRDAGQRDAAPREGLADGGPSISVQPDSAVPTTMRAGGRSAGCGRTRMGTDNFEDRMLQAAGMVRTYHLRIPLSYDKERAYPVVFRWHGTGGNGTSGGLGIEYPADQGAIVVGPDGLGGGWTARTEPSDLQFFDVLYEEIASNYCVDLAKVYAYGFSAGGGISNALGCKRASKIRATAVLAGFDRGDATCAGTPVAAWFQHDESDPSVPITQGSAARDRAIARNGCSEAAAATDGCQAYQGCKAAFPVVWCQTMGLGHNIAGDSAPAKVWAFFSRLPQF